jgi:hypothetical protein
LRASQRRFASASLLVAAALGAIASATIACSSSDEPPTSTFDAGAEAGDASDDIGFIAPGPLPRVCPTEVPMTSSSCETAGLWCEYGDGGPHSTCTTAALCDVIAKTGGTLGWHITPPTPTCGIQPTDCPSSYGEPLDAACPSQGICNYSEGRCECVICDDYDGSPEQNQWRCRAWSDVPGIYVDGGATAPNGTCPAERPRLGTPCNDTTVVCGYDSCNDISIGPYQFCDLGTWSVGPQTDSCNHPGCR